MPSRYLIPLTLLGVGLEPRPLVNKPQSGQLQQGRVPPTSEYTTGHRSCGRAHTHTHTHTAQKYTHLEHLHKGRAPPGPGFPEKLAGIAHTLEKNKSCLPGETVPHLLALSLVLLQAFAR